MCECDCPRLRGDCDTASLNFFIRGEQEGLFKLVTLDRILNRITGVASGCWWLVVVNAIPISDICQINQ
jgi:hypothetical protein